MDAKTDNTPPGWLEELEEDIQQSDAEYEAGIFVTSEEVHLLLRDSIAELEARRRFGSGMRPNFVDSVHAACLASDRKTGTALPETIARRGDHQP